MYILYFILYLLYIKYYIYIHDCQSELSFNSSMTSFFSATAWRSFASTKFIRWNSPRTCSALSTET